MARTEPIAVIDMTGGDATFRYVEIHTDAGIIRVNAGLITNPGLLRGRHECRSVVSVEIEANASRYGVVKTPPGGDWEISIPRGAAPDYKTDVTLTRTDRTA
jgi:hypothetical protein